VESFIFHPLYCSFTIIGTRARKNRPDGMIVFGNSTNLWYQSPSAVLLYNGRIDKPVMAGPSMSFPGPPLPPNEPTNHNESGRISETSAMQRFAHIDLLKPRTGERRVEEWVKSQVAIQSSSILSLASPQPQPARQKRQAYVVPPRHRHRRRHTTKTVTSSPLSSSWFSPCELDVSLAHQVPGNISDDTMVLTAPSISYSPCPNPIYPTSLSYVHPKATARRYRHSRRLSVIPEVLELEE